MAVTSQDDICICFHYKFFVTIFCFCFPLLLSYSCFSLVSSYASTHCRLEAGTPAIAQAIGLGAAIDYLSNIGMETIYDYEVTKLVFLAPYDREDFLSCILLVNKQPILWNILLYFDDYDSLTNNQLCGLFFYITTNMWNILIYYDDIKTLSYLSLSIISSKLIFQYFMFQLTRITRVIWRLAFYSKENAFDGCKL